MGDLMIPTPNKKKNWENCEYISFSFFEQLSPGSMIYFTKLSCKLKGM